MSNGAEIRFVNNKMEVKKKNDMFEFLPSNTDNYGSLFSIRAIRKTINNESAYMARKTGCINDNNNQDRNKKVKFNENASTYIYIYIMKRTKKKRIKLIKIQRRKKSET